MSKKKTNKPAPEKSVPSEQKSALQRAAEADLGEFAGITMGEKKDKGEEATESTPQEEIVLSVAEDRTRLVVQGVLYLLLAFFGLFLILGGIGATQISQSVAYLILVLVGLPLAWFASKAMGRRLSRFVSHTDVIDFGEKNVHIYAEADRKKAIVVSYKDIKSYKLIRQGKALRLLLSGDWVKHPSGFHFVDVNRPFMADTLDELETQILDVLRAHHVKQAKK